MIFRSVLLGGLFIALAASVGANAQVEQRLEDPRHPGIYDLSSSHDVIRPLTTGKRFEAMGLMITRPEPWIQDKGIPAHRNSIFIVGTRTKTSVLTNNERLDRALTFRLARSGVYILGGDMQAACAGFRYLGDCLAAIHVAKDQDLPGGFPALKDMTTGENSVKLREAVQQLKPESDAKAIQKQAKRQARFDLRGLNGMQPQF